MSRSGSLVKPDDQRAFGHHQLRRQRYAGHPGYVRRFDPTVRQIEAGRRLRGTRNAHETDIGFVDAPARLPVIVIEREGHRIDTREIFVVEEMLLAGDPPALAVEMRCERSDYRIEHRDRRHLQTAASFLQLLPKRVVYQRKENYSGIGLDPGDHPVDLAASADHAPHMLDRLRIVELHQTGARHRMNRLAGGIRNQVKVKAGHDDGARDRLPIPSTRWIISDNPGTTRQGRLSRPTSPRYARAIHPSGGSEANFFTAWEKPG